MPKSSAIRKKSPAKKTTSRKLSKPTKKAAPAKTPKPPMKSEAERIIDAMRELAAHLRNPEKCLTLEAYNKLAPRHRILFDKLMQAISKRTFGDTPA